LDREEADFKFQGVVVEKSLAEIAQYVGGKVVGDAAVVIKGFAGLRDARPGDLSFLSNIKYKNLLSETKASAVLVFSHEEFSVNTNLIKVENPSLAFSQAVALFIEEPPVMGQGIHPSAVVSERASIGKDVMIGACAVIEDDVVIGDRTKILSGTFVGFKSQIGKECLIYPNVTIRENAKIGDRVIIHSGTVIGSDGFGYVSEEGVHHKIPQIGIVEIEDDVEIGANVTVDRARFDKTFIGKGTKIDNLVQIAHNVRIGRHCLIVSHVGISGSVVIEDNVVLGGQVGVAGHVTIGKGSMVAAQSGVTQSVDPGSILFGSPAQPHMKAKRVNAAVGKLPEYLKIIRNLEARILELEKKVK
jgi:UDP-3-O-[3-hydroxymyristoyl] glucosamine N-acyltransferase